MSIDIVRRTEVFACSLKLYLLYFIFINMKLKYNYTINSILSNFNTNKKTKYIENKNNILSKIKSYIIIQQMVKVEKDNNNKL
jgi:hypothetical protein